LSYTRDFNTLAFYHHSIWHGFGTLSSLANLFAATGACLRNPEASSQSAARSPLVSAALTSCGHLADPMLRGSRAFSAPATFRLPFVGLILSLFRWLQELSTPA